MKLKLNPITIPPAIMAITATPAEKLALAIYAADPVITPWRVHRALSVTPVGLKKLKARLRGKGFLEGHKVSVFKASENVHKVAPPDASPLYVHAELLDIRYLLASEKVLCAFYAAHPDAINERVCRELGISPSGLKKLKRGLIDKLVLVPTSAGHTVRLPGYVLIREKAGSRFIPEAEAIASGHVVTLPSPRLVPAMDIYRAWSAHFDYLISKNESPSTHLWYTEKMIKRVEAESPDSPERDTVLETLRNLSNVDYAMDFVSSNAPKNDEQRLVNQISSGTPEQWAAFRVQVEGAQLAGIPPQKLLGYLGEVQQAAAGTGGTD